ERPLPRGLRSSGSDCSGVWCKRGAPDERLHRPIGQRELHPAGADVRRHSAAAPTRDPLIMAIALCLILAVLYLLGGRRPVRLLDAPRRWNGRHWRATAFLGGLGMAAVCLSAPVDTLMRVSMSTRTAQLVALLMVAAPLIVLGAPEPRLRRLLNRSPRPARPRLALPVVAFLLL